MRRISLALAIIASVLVAGTKTHAATAPSHSTGIAGILKHMDTLGHGGTITGRLAYRDGPLAVSRSGSNASASQLLLPTSAFSPAVINTTYSGTITVSDADSDWFRTNHSAAYETWGFQFGGYQRADWSASNPAGAFRWQGSYMSSASNATAAYNDGINYISSQTGASASSCTSGSIQCSVQLFTYNDNSNVNWTEEYVVLQYNQCLGEISADVPTSSYSSLSSQVSSTAANIAGAGATAMGNACGTGSPPTSTPPTVTPTPTKPAGKTSFSLLAARFEKNGAKPDWNLTGVPLTQAKVGTKIQLSMYINVASLASSSVPMVREYTLKRGGTTVAHFQSTADNITDVDTYRYYYPQGGLKLSKAGTYTFTARVTLGGKTQSASATLQAVAKVRTAKKVSFTFNSLQTQTDSGQVTSTFRTGQSINLHLSWTVKHLKGNTQSLISRSLLANLGGQWKAVNTSHITETTVNGKNQATVSLQISSPGSFQIAVAISVASGSQSRKVGVTVR